MKIAWLMPNLHSGGGPRLVMELGSEMVTRGHEFSIYIPTSRCRTPVKPGIRIVECGWGVKNALLAVPLTLAAIPARLNRPDIILASMPPYALLAEKIGREKHIPVVNFMQGDDLKLFDEGTYIESSALLSLYHWIALRSFRVENIWVNSHWTGVQLIKHSGRRPTAIIPGGYNSEYFYPSPSPPLASDGIIRLVTVGRKPRSKGLPDLIEALNRLDLMQKPFVLKVITQDDLNLSTAKFPVEIITPCDDVELSDCYRSGDVFVNASWQEGFGLTPLEAMACGLAVVTTNCGGVREFVQPEVNALVVPPREPRTLAEALARLMEDEALRQRLVKRGVETSADFTWTLIADRFERQLIQTVAEFH